MATLFAQGLAVVSLAAWLSLGSQVQVLIGSRGLLPVADYIAAARTQAGVSLFDLPSLAWWFHSDGALTAGIALGVALSLGALFGVARRPCFALSTLLYLSYVSVTRDFLSFQWDNLLLECGFLAVFLPTRRTDAPAPVAHFLFRVVLFKLYFESGIAKWQSPIRDWQDGSAMTYYYETAPLPTWVAWYAHHLPVWWHHFESRATLVLELVIPFAIFGPRKARLFALASFTLFQIVNAATANYGFFCYLAVVLGVFLLDDRDVEAARARLDRFVPAVRRLSAKMPRLPRFRAPPLLPAEARRWLGLIGAGALCVISFADAYLQFGPSDNPPALLAPALRVAWRLRFVNTYHLFQSITRERIEPEVQTLSEGSTGAADGEAGEAGAWTAQHFKHKPGDVARAPDFVAPHQPRVDFRLWFYGLAFQRRSPAYVSTLLERLCEDPEAVQTLFRAPLPPRPAAVRLVFWQYWFTSATERKSTGAWWRRTRLATTRAVPCPHVP